MHPAAKVLCQSTAVSRTLTFVGIEQRSKTMFTKVEQLHGSNLKCHEVVVHNTVFKNCVKHVAMQRCHIAQWQDEPIVKNSTVQLRASLLDCAWVSASRYSTQNFAPHSARLSGLPRTCSSLDTLWNFRSTTMSLICSRTGFVEKVPKGRWRYFALHNVLWKQCSLWRMTLMG